MPDAILPALLAGPAPPVAVYRSKLEPPRFAGNWVRRDRVEQRLDRALACSLVVVAAPAGHGKTSTVADWLRRRRIVPAWVTLDPRDADLTRLATHVAVAIDGVAAGTAEALIPLLTAANRLPPRDLGEAFGEALYDLAGDLVLVLDDAHAIDREAGGAFVAGLVRAAPRRLHTILVSREQPAFPLSRLRTAGEVEELGGADLRFSVAETAELLRVESRTEVGAADAERVRAAVGGWPAAVRLIAIGHRLGRAGRPSEIGSDGRRAVLDYLGEEVLARLPAVQRAALQRASLVERFTGELMAVLAGAPDGRPLAEADIEQLRALDLFREVPGQAETWYAFHPLFRDVLRRDLERTTAEPALADTRRTAAGWLAGAGRVREAVDLLVAIGDIAQAAATIEARLDDAFNREDWQSVASWVRAVPFEEVLNRTELLLATAWVGLLGGREARIAEALAAIRQPSLRDRVSAAQQAEIDLLADWPEEPRADEEEWSRWVEEAVAAIPPGRRYQRGYARLMLAMSLAEAGRADEALERLASFTDSASARIDAESIRGWFGRTIVLWQTGRLAQCGRAAADLLQLAQTNGLPVSAGWGAAFVGFVAHELGDAEAAAAQFDRVIGDADRIHYTCVRNAFFEQILLYQAAGRAAEADRALERLRELAIATESRNQLALVDAMAARVALLRGEVDVARRWLESSPPEPGSDDLKQIEVRGLTRAKVLVALGTPSSLTAARAALDALVAAARAERMALALIEGLAVRALLHEAVGDRLAAGHDLRESLRLAAPERIVQRFAYLGPGLQPLLRRAAHDPAVAAHARLVLKVAESVAACQRGAAAPPARAAAPLPSPLSAREREVLHCLARRLTNDEIGDELYISPVTVKHHVANLSGKLGASGRRSAVTRAIELGLLDPDSTLRG